MKHRTSSLGLLLAVPLPTGLVAATLEHSDVAKESAHVLSDGRVLIDDIVFEKLTPRRSGTPPVGARP